MMESIERLRFHIERHFESWEVEHGRLMEFCDEIEREIAEKYMPLPLDADGVPIRIGDMLTESGDPCKFEVMSLTYYEDCVAVNACGANPKLCRHAKPRTVEEVLHDVIMRCIGHSPEYWNKLIAEYADELHEMMSFREI